MKILITLLKPLSFLPALLMMYIIFSFSAQPGEVSGNLSYKISYEIIETKSELLSENLSSEEIAYKADGIHYYVRKAAHMTEYFLLAIAISFPLYVYGVRGIWLMLTAGNTEIEVRIMWGLFRNGKHWKRGIFWITVISI